MGSRLQSAGVRQPITAGDVVLHPGGSLTVFRLGSKGLSLSDVFRRLVGNLDRSDYSEKTPRSHFDDGRRTSIIETRPITELLRRILSQLVDYGPIFNGDWSDSFLANEFPDADRLLSDEIDLYLTQFPSPFDQTHADSLGVESSETGSSDVNDEEPVVAPQSASIRTRIEEERQAHFEQEARRRQAFEAAEEERRKQHDREEEEERTRIKKANQVALDEHLARGLRAETYEPVEYKRREFRSAPFSERPFEPTPESTPPTPALYKAHPPDTSANRISESSLEDQILWVSDALSLSDKDLEPRRIELRNVSPLLDDVRLRLDGILRREGDRTLPFELMDDCFALDGLLWLFALRLVRNEPLADLVGAVHESTAWWLPRKQAVEVLKRRPTTSIAPLLGQVDKFIGCMDERGYCKPKADIGIARAAMDGLAKQLLDLMNHIEDARNGDGTPHPWHVEGTRKLVAADSWQWVGGVRMQADIHQVRWISLDATHQGEWERYPTETPDTSATFRKTY